MGVRGQNIGRPADAGVEISLPRVAPGLCGVETTTAILVSWLHYIERSLTASRSSGETVHGHVQALPEVFGVLSPSGLKQTAVSCRLVSLNKVSKQQCGGRRFCRHGPFNSTSHYRDHQAPTFGARRPYNEPRPGWILESTRPDRDRTMSCSSSFKLQRPGGVAITPSQKIKKEIVPGNGTYS